MRPSLTPAIDRIASLRAGLGAGVPDAEVEAALVDGYAEALAGDGWLAELAQRVHIALDDASTASSGPLLRELTWERRGFERNLRRLREELRALREEREQVRTAS